MLFFYILINDIRLDLNKKIESFIIGKNNTPILNNIPFFHIYCFSKMNEKYFNYQNYFILHKFLFIDLHSNILNKLMYALKF